MNDTLSSVLPGDVNTAGCTSHSKGPSPHSDELVPLFNPRTDNWHDHFRWDGYHVTGITSVGRATVDALLLNRDRRIRIRQAEVFFGLFPSNDNR